MIEVTYLVLSSMERVTKVFTNEYEARKLKNKLKHSKRCVLVSYLVFDS